MVREDAPFQPDRFFVPSVAAARRTVLHHLGIGSRWQHRPEEWTELFRAIHGRDDVLRALTEAPTRYWLVYSRRRGRYQAFDEPWMASLAMVQSLFGEVVQPAVRTVIREYVRAEKGDQEDIRTAVDWGSSVLRHHLDLFGARWAGLRSRRSGAQTLSKEAIRTVLTNSHGECRGPSESGGPVRPGAGELRALRAAAAP